MEMKYSLLFIFIIKLIFLPLNEAASILIVAPCFGSAHIKIMESISYALHDRGHNITIITMNAKDNLPENYRQIKVEKDLEFENSDFSDEAVMTHYGQLNGMWEYAIPAMKFMLDSPEVQDFIKNDNSHFDLVINEVFYQEFGYAFAYKYNASLIATDTTTLFNHIADFMGNPLPMVYANHEAFKKNIDTFFGKLENILLINFDRIGRKYYYLPQVDKLVKEYFSCWNISLPSVEEMENRVSLTMINNHFSFDNIIPLIPGIVQIGGIHIQPPKLLPENIQKFLDDAKEGAIYFSLGSVWQTRFLGDEKINAFINAFKKLNQRIIWKIDEKIPEMHNVLSGKWFPQNDILAHPNVKLFISHGGMLSTQEAVHYAVPVLGIPIIWDQYSNIHKLKKYGTALKLDYLNFNTDDIVKAVKEIFENSNYMKNMKKLSDKYNDRLNSPKDFAVYWTEYVIRHKESKFLKSPSVDFSFWEYYLVEIIIILITSFCTALIYLISGLMCKSNKINQSISKTKRQDKKIN